MKRIICLALVLVLLFQVLVVPAAAVDPLTGIIVTASAATVIGSALIGLGVLPGSDGSVFDGIVSGAADYLASLGFGDGVGFPVLKYLGLNGTFQYALQSSVMVALRNWLFDEEVVSPPVSSSVFSVAGTSYSLVSDYPVTAAIVHFTADVNPYWSFMFFTPLSTPAGSITLNGRVLNFSSSDDFKYYTVWTNYGAEVPFSGINLYDLGFFPSFSDYTFYLRSLDYSFFSSFSSPYDVTLGDVAAPDTSLSVGYPNWAIDSVQVDPGNGDDPIPYVPIGLDDRYDGITQEDVQSGESTLETPNEGTEVTISGEVGGSLTPDGGGSGDLPGGEGSVTVDDLTTMFAWLAVRIDEAVQSLFPDLQVIKTYLKTIAQWHETENVKYDSMLSYFSGWDADIDTMLTTVSNIDLNLTTLVDHAATSADTLAAIAADVQDIRDVIADPLDSDINEEEQDNKNAFLNTFSKKSQAKSIGDLSGLSDGFTDWFALDVDPGLMFDQFDTGFGDWFTSETAQAISVGGGAAAAGISLMDDDPYVEPDTPYLDAWDREVQDILSGGE